MFKNKNINNPITREDGDGEFWHIVAGAIAGGTEAIYDFSSYLINKLIESIDGR